MPEDTSTPQPSQPSSDAGMGDNNPISGAPAGDQPTTEQEQSAVQDQINNFVSSPPASDGSATPVSDSAGLGTPSAPASDSSAGAAPASDPAAGGEANIPMSAPPADGAAPEAPAEPSAPGSNPTPSGTL